MSARYPFGTHKGSFPSRLEVITANRDVYGALTGLPTAVAVPARVTRSRIEEMDTQPAVETNRVKTYLDGIKAYMPPVEETAAIVIGSVLRYQGIYYTVLRVVAPVDVSDTTAHVMVEATLRTGAP